MGYSDDESMVRVDFFKESGKWHCTEAVRWKTWEGSLERGGKLIHDAFAEALLAHLRDASSGWSSGKRTRLEEMTAVCLEPYHEHAHPLMMKVSEAVAIVDGTRPKHPMLRPRINGP